MSFLLDHLMEQKIPSVGGGVDIGKSAREDFGQLSR
jgi:hypothetical protein